MNKLSRPVFNQLSLSEKQVILQESAVNRAYATTAAGSVKQAALLPV